MDSLHFRTNKTAKASEQHEAVLRMLQIAGFFKAEELWQTGGALNLKQPELVYEHLYKVALKSAATEDPSQFNAKYMRKNFGKSVPDLDLETM